KGPWHGPTADPRSTAATRITHAAARIATPWFVTIGKLHIESRERRQWPRCRSNCPNAALLQQKRLILLALAETSLRCLTESWPLGLSFWPGILQKKYNGLRSCTSNPWHWLDASEEQSGRHAATRSELCEQGAGRGDRRAAADLRGRVGGARRLDGALRHRPRAEHGRHRAARPALRRDAHAQGKRGLPGSQGDQRASSRARGSSRGSARRRRPGL